MAGKLKFRKVIILSCLSTIMLTTAAQAQERQPPLVADADALAVFTENDEVDKAVDKGLGWLVQQQDVTHGGFTGTPANTVTALACMALMAAGHFEGRSPYGEHLQRGIMFLVKAAEKNPYLGSDGGRMYGHGIATLALCEAYGMMAKPEDNLAIRNALLKCMDVILKAQSQNGAHSGGWRYNPQPNDADLSVTAWQILVLRALQNCGFNVPQPAIDRATDYVRNVFIEGKGFAYQKGGNPSTGMRAAGIVCMKILGADEESQDIQKIETSAKVFDTVDPSTGSHYYYQAYYLATAANMMGEKYRENFLPRQEEALLKLQTASGEFKKHTGHAGGVYSTAFAVVSLAVRYQFLPIYQE